jgi:hypothetical protein
MQFLLALGNIGKEMSGFEAILKLVSEKSAE